MTDTISCDTSEFQPAVSDSYPHKWYIFRACDGTYRDPKFLANYAWAEHAAVTGKITGYTIYCVYRPGVDVFSVVRDMVGSPSEHLTVLIDVESWRGQITGNQSRRINRLARQFAKWLGSKQRVLGYGNQGDLVSLYPRRLSWLRLIVAAYTSTQPQVPNMIGWQYTDGSSNWPTQPGLPRSSPPFGNCDHNVFPGLTPLALANELGVGPQVKEPHVSVFNVGLLRAAIFGGKYATKPLRDKYPRLARPVGLRDQVDQHETTIRKLEAAIAVLEKSPAHKAKP